MSSPDIKLRKLSLAHFRGARELIELDFGTDFRSCILFGFNGEGKSTFAQAIEWFYRDSVAALTGEGVEKEDIVNLGASAKDETIVSIVFSKKELSASKLFKKDKGKSEWSNKSTEFIDYIENKSYYDRLYLNQHSILWFLAKPKGQKKDEIAKIIGYEDIVNVRNSIAGALRDLERSTYLSDIRQRIANNDGLMASNIYGDIVNTVDDLFQKSSTLLKKLGYEEKILSLGDLETAIAKAIKLIPNEQKTKDRIELENIKAKVVSLEKKIRISKALTDWQKRFNELVQNKDVLSKLNLSDFLRNAEKIIKTDSSLKYCPLCEQDINREALLRSVVDRYQKYSSARANLTTLEEELSRIKITLAQLEREMDDLEKLLNVKTIVYLKDTLQTLKLSLPNISSELSLAFQNRSQSLLDATKIDEDSKKASESLIALNATLQSMIDKLSITQDEKEKQSIFQALFRGKDIALETIKYRKEVRLFEKQISDMQYIDEQMLQLQNHSLKTVLDLMSTDINKYFYFLNKKNRVKDVKLEIKGEAGIEFNLDFYGNEASPPKKYLSESQLNSLGIALFLAAVKKFNRVNRFFILDDVLISFDRRYRLRLLELLKKEFSDYQVLLLTHESFWYEMIKRQFPEWVKKEVTWSFEKGIRFKDDSSDWLKEAKTKLEAGEKVGNDLRIGMENLLKHLCLALEVRLPFKLDEDNEKRMIGELFPALTATLNKKKSPIPSHHDYKSLEVSSFIANSESHDNPDLDSKADLEETIEKIRKFQGLFICVKGETVQKSLKVPGQDKISCKCGQLQIDWKD
ncbi:MAG: hypothetical protein Q8O30_12560 [Candidatus Omnitrophota bacterium]|nr:hypothetical protein [Candidatus Omnitrophota bacterium]